MCPSTKETNLTVIAISHRCKNMRKINRLEKITNTRSTKKKKKQKKHEVRQCHGFSKNSFPYFKNAFWRSDFEKFLVHYTQKLIWQWHGDFQHLLIFLVFT